MDEIEQGLQALDDAELQQWTHDQAQRANVASGRAFGTPSLRQLAYSLAVAGRFEQLRRTHDQGDDKGGLVRADDLAGLPEHARDDVIAFGSDRGEHLPERMPTLDDDHGDA